MIEKVALALVLTARRMHPYFQNHSITVRTDYPIFKILSKPDLAGRMIGWLVKLSKFNIRYQPRGLSSPSAWSTSRLSSHRYPPCRPGDLLLEQALQFGFKANNNQDEYEALFVGLNLAYDMGAREVMCKSDSQVMVDQINGEFEVKEPLLQRYYHAARNRITRFNKAPLEHIPREENKRSDALSKLSVTQKKSHQRSVILIWLRHPSVSETECLAIVESETDNWMTPIIQYLEDGRCKPEEEKIMKQQCARYTMINADLYRRGYSTPY